MSFTINGLQNNDTVDGLSSRITFFKSIPVHFDCFNIILIPFRVDGRTSNCAKMWSCPTKKCDCSSSLESSPSSMEDCNCANAFLIDFIFFPISLKLSLLLMDDASLLELGQCIWDDPSYHI